MSLMRKCGMRMRRRPGFLVLCLLAATLGVAASCNKKSGSGSGGPSPTKTVPSLQYTPMPNPPTPTLRPGQPTRLPALPG